MTLTPQWLDELRARTLVSALVGRSVKLTKAGREHKGCCPFHNEKTPSFYVNDEKGFYHCFGCGAHGDAIRWMTDQRGLPFIDAVKELAEAAGMEMPAPDPRAAEKAERANSLHDVMASAAAWFSEQLGSIEGAEARAYLERRGIRGDTIKRFGLGFSPDSRGKLRAALKQFGDDKLVEAGLLIQVDEKEPYDRFRGRLMIPIRDPRGRVIAFGGRILGQGEPKYLNSPDTPLFDKGRTLYNLDLASPAARKAARMIVVEGYMDVIALAQAGIEEAVAPLGTALTEFQIERLWRQVDVPILCFDGDAAGQKAAVRAIGRALPGLEPARSLSFITLPQGQDPDDLIKSGGRSAMEALLSKPEPLVERLWRHELEALPLSTPEARAGLRQRMGEHARAIADANVREQYQAEFRDRFDAQFRRAPPPRRDGRAPQKGRTNWGYEAPLQQGTKSIGGGGVEPLYARALLCGLLRHPAAIMPHVEALAALPLPDDGLSQLRDALLAEAGRGAALDSGTILPICESRGLGDVARALLDAKSLDFSFTRRQADALRAQKDLGMVIEALAARPALDKALAAATARLSEHWDEAGFAEQTRLLAARQDADSQLAELVETDAEIDRDKKGKHGQN